MQSLPPLTPSAPWLPPELIVTILEDVWASPLTTAERTATFRSASLVNRMWLGLFLRIALRHAYLPPLDVSTYLSLLPERTNADAHANPFTTEASFLANKICQSLTFDVDGRAPGDEPIGTPGEIKMNFEVDTSSISTVLNMVSTLNHLPNLRHISLRYTNWGYEDAFEQLSISVFPPQVTSLSIEYDACSAHARETYPKSFYTRRPQPWVTLPRVRRLAIAGAPTGFAADMVQVCPEVETVELLRPTRVDELAPLPPSVRTLVIRHPHFLLQSEQMLWWKLEDAVADGLFAARGGRVIIRAGTPDPHLFWDMQRLCRKHHVELVYVREDVAHVRL
ncbi:uncharacterized protein BXZ73DRAFT_89396 [Epithele typhae]|uniref:uncharacterized protein n=1 Tax=Epithele typhae TaxID=378194 RepID=UPI0020073A81|nr:uncharacterized protein BXZ73DRAFT_89396 [Epithele typhae]KAH9935902.1 hypothetical protein BXZ73DRAFT_89396 [Epithele typhae]